MRDLVRFGARVAAVCAAGVCALGAPAAAQHPRLAPVEPRPLHVQLAGADAAAVALVARVATGRIELVEGRAVLGSPPPRFELKRAPSAPPPLAEGDRALLLLRGARTPYVLASEPAELIRLADGDDGDVWSSGLRALRDAGTSGADLAAAYAAWLDARSPRLLREAALGLAHEDCPAPAVEAVALRLAELALSADDPGLRRFAARAAVRTVEGRRRLLEELPSQDPSVLLTALSATPASDRSAASEAVLRSLRHGDAAVRGVALRFVSRFRDDPRIRARLVHVSSEDPDPELRELARRVMKSGG